MQATQFVPDKEFPFLHVRQELAEPEHVKHVEAHLVHVLLLLR